MISKNTTMTPPGFSDLFSTLMQTSTVDEKPARDVDSEDWWGSDKSNDVYEEGRGNKNLSKEIERIRDDGPVTNKGKVQPVRRQSYHAGRNVVSREKKPFVQKYQTEIEKNRRRKISTLPIDKKPPVEKNRIETVKSAATAVKKANKSETVTVARKSFSHQLMELMVLLVLGALIYGFYYLYAQNQDLKNIINGYEERLENNNQAQKVSELIQHKVETMNGRIEGMSKALQGVRADYTEMDEKIEIGMDERYQPEAFDVSDIREDITALRSEFERSQRKASKFISPAKKKTQLNVVSTSTSVDLWLVNLASLSSKGQAEMWLEKLEKAGYKSMLDEKMVNGSRFYRLSVSGFSSYDEAVQFIAMAKSRYGFEGGWVRRS